MLVGLTHAADRAVRPVVLNKNAALRSGTVLREKREIRVENGVSRQANAQETTEVRTRYLQRINLVRRITGAGSEEIRASEFLTELAHFTGPPPPPGEEASPLMTKTMRARKTGARWDYDLERGKETPEERSSLDHLAYTAALLDMISLCIGTDSHKPGDTWKTSIPAPRGKAAGYVVPKDIECTFVSLDEKADGPQAVISITGSLGLERPMGYNAHVDISFQATVHRRLSDMLDVETNITGEYVLKGEANIAGVGKTQLDFRYPYTLKRSLQIEDK